MRKIFGLYGAANVGKSQTIKEVYNLLSSEYKTAKIKHQILESDIIVVLTIDGITIGIESQGDPNSRLAESLSLFVKMECNIIICATRTRGQTVDAVNKLVKNHEYEVLWLKQDVKSDGSEYESNKAMARRIVDEIEKTIIV